MSDLRFHDLKRRRSPRRLKLHQKIAKKFRLTRWSCQPGTCLDSTQGLWGNNAWIHANWFGLVHTHNPIFHEIFFIAEYAQLLWISNCMKIMKIYLSGLITKNSFAMVKVLLQFFFKVLSKKYGVCL